MRTVSVGTALICLLGVGFPANAQTADPLGLIGVGALVPYFGAGQGGETSILELFSPVGDAPDVHMFFFGRTCTRGGPSVGLPLTPNDVGRIQLEAIRSIPDSGLIAIAAVSETGFELRPLTTPIHARVRWIDSAQDFERVLEPIALVNAEAPDTGQTWNPLRTAATFYAPPDRGGTQSTLVLICPTANIITGAFPPTFFPELVPHPVVSGATPLRMRVYDEDEKFLGAISTSCGCLSRIPLRGLSPIYGDVAAAPSGTYTEVLGGAGVNAALSFTGYLATQAGGRDRFGRLSNGSRPSVQGTLTTGVR